MVDDRESPISVSVNEAARELAVSPQTLRKWIWRGLIPAFSVRNTRGFRWRVLIDQVPPGLCDGKERSAKKNRPVEMEDLDDRLDDSASYSSHVTLGARPPRSSRAEVELGWFRASPVG